MLQDETGCRWPGFSHILNCLQSSKDGWEPKKENTISGPSYHLYAMFLPDTPVFYETGVHNEQ